MKHNFLLPVILTLIGSLSFTTILFFTHASYERSLMHAKLKNLATMDENIKIILDTLAYKSDCKNVITVKPEDIKPKDSLPPNNILFGKYKTFSSATNLWPSYPWKRAFNRLIKSLNSTVEQLMSKEK